MTSEWNKVLLAEITSKIGSGATPRGGKESYYAEGLSLIRSQNVLDFKFSENGLAFINQKQAYELRNVEVLEGDILLNITGDSVARACLVPTEILPARVNQHVAIIRVNTQVADPNFILYSLLNPSFKKYMLMVASDGGTRNALTKGDIEKFEIKLPDLKIQEDIAKTLSALDDKISLLRRQNETLEQIAQTIFRHWFVDFEFPDEHGNPYKSSGGRFVSSELGDIPEGWQVGKLGDLTEVNPRETMKKGSLRKFVEMKSLSNIGLAISSFSYREFSSGSKFRNGDTLLARITPCLENGKTAYVDILEDEEVAWGSTEFIVLRARANSCSGFVYCLARNEEFRRYVIKNMTGSSGRKRVPTDVVVNYDCYIPNEIAMRNFEDLSSASLKKISANSKQIRDLTKIRNLLLPKLMTGQIQLEENHNDWLWNECEEKELEEQKLYLGCK